MNRCHQGTIRRISEREWKNTESQEHAWQEKPKKRKEELKWSITWGFCQRHTADLCSTCGGKETLKNCKDPIGTANKWCAPTLCFKEKEYDAEGGLIKRRDDFFFNVMTMSRMKLKPTKMYKLSLPTGGLSDKLIAWSFLVLYVEMLNFLLSQDLTWKVHEHQSIWSKASCLS